MCCSLHEIAQVVTQSPGLVPGPAGTDRQVPDVFVVGQGRQAQFQGFLPAVSRKDQSRFREARGQPETDIRRLVPGF